MELLSEVLVNNGMKNKEEYLVSKISIYATKLEDRKRHITKNNIYLCGHKSDYLPAYTLHDYSINNIDGYLYIPICKTCLNKLPKKVKEEFIYNWTVTKLKAK